MEEKTPHGHSSPTISRNYILNEHLRTILVTGFNDFAKHVFKCVCFSSVEGNKLRLRDISPSRLRERRKKHERKKSDRESKLSPSSSARKNIVSHY